MSLFHIPFRASETTVVYRVKFRKKFSLAYKTLYCVQGHTTVYRH